VVEVRTAAEPRAGRYIGKKSGVGLVHTSAAEPAKERILIVNHVVRSNVKIIPVFDYSCGVGVVVEQTKTRAILRLVAIWFREKV
jgi:hypothetical protein